MHEDEISERIIGAAIEVHKFFGPGLVEQIYEESLCHEFSCAAFGSSGKSKYPFITKA
jgi:GxxExxY protein